MQSCPLLWHHSRSNILSFSAIMVAVELQLLWCHRMLLFVLQTSLFKAGSRLLDIFMKHPPGISSLSFLFIWFTYAGKRSLYFEKNRSVNHWLCFLTYTIVCSYFPCCFFTPLHIFSLSAAFRALVEENVKFNVQNIENSSVIRNVLLFIY